MKRYRLRREIKSPPVLANAMVDMVGPTFATRVKSAPACDAAIVATAFEAARKMFRLNAPAVAQVVAPSSTSRSRAPVQMSLFQAVAQELRAQTYCRLARRASAKGSRAGPGHDRRLSPGGGRPARGGPGPPGRLRPPWPSRPARPSSSPPERPRSWPRRSPRSAPCARRSEIADLARDSRLGARSRPPSCSAHTVGRLCSASTACAARRRVSRRSTASNAAPPAS